MLKISDINYFRPLSAAFRHSSKKLVSVGRSRDLATNRIRSQPLATYFEPLAVRKRIHHCTIAAD